MEKRRLEWLDALKGIGIILVVSGHSAAEGVLQTYIYSFHMPLFFFISGYGMAAVGYRGIGEIIRKKSRSLLIPYGFFSAITYVIWFALRRSFSGEPQSDVEFYIPLLGIFYSAPYKSFLIHNKPLWFLTCLFVAEVVVFLSTEVLRKTQYFKAAAISVGLGISILGYCVSLYSGFRLPWSVEVALVGSLFLTAGYLFHGYQDVLQSKMKPNYALRGLTLCLFVCVGMGLSSLNGFCNMVDAKYNNFLLFLVAAFLGIGACYIAAVSASHNGLLRFLGENSLLIFGFNLTLLWMTKGVMFFGLGYKLKNIGDSFFEVVIMSGVCILFSLPIIFVVRRYLPFILGKRGVEAGTLAGV
jgi:acyltransferase